MRCFWEKTLCVLRNGAGPCCPALHLLPCNLRFPQLYCTQSTPKNNAWETSLLDFLEPTVLSLHRCPHGTHKNQIPQLAGASPPIEHVVDDAQCRFQNFGLGRREKERDAQPLLQHGSPQPFDPPLPLPTVARKRQRVGHRVHRAKHMPRSRGRVARPKPNCVQIDEPTRHPGGITEMKQVRSVVPPRARAHSAPTACRGKYCSMIDEGNFACPKEGATA